MLSFSKIVHEEHTMPKSAVTQWQQITKGQLVQYAPKGHTQFDPTTTLLEYCRVNKGVSFKLPLVKD